MAETPHPEPLPALTPLARGSCFSWTAPLYAKIFASIYQGTLRGNAHGLLVFTNLLAHADEQGVADIHPRAISQEIGLTLEETQAALDFLESPDPDSRSPEDEGRRISRIDEHRSWGWFITNHAKYAAIRKADDRKLQINQAVKRHRERKKVKSVEIICNQPESMKAHIDLDIDLNTYAQKENSEPEKDQTSPEAYPANDDAKPAEQGDRANGAAPGAGIGICEEIYKAYPRHEAKKRAMLAIEDAIRRHPADRILAQTRAYAAQQRRADKRYIPFADKWFNEERYLDQEGPVIDQNEQSIEMREKAEADGEALFAQGKSYGDVMSELNNRYGDVVSFRAARARGWKR